MRNAKNNAKKIATIVAGMVVLLVGIVAIPYPGPGWLIVFAGLAILAREFEWAARLLGFARDKYDTWVRWLSRQPLAVRMVIVAATGTVIVVTIWLMNGFGLLNAWLHLPYDWVESPLLR